MVKPNGEPELTDPHADRRKIFRSPQDVAAWLTDDKRRVAVSENGGGPAISYLCVAGIWDFRTIADTSVRVSLCDQHGPWSAICDEHGPIPEPVDLDPLIASAMALPWRGPGTRLDAVVRAIVAWAKQSFEAKEPEETP